MLATGCSTHLASVLHTEKMAHAAQCLARNWSWTTALVRGAWTSTNQLRLQRYSFQKCISLRKYYRQLFLCIVDVAVVNGCIVHCITRKNKDEKMPTHAEYLCRLHIQLLALRTIDSETHPDAEDLVAVPIPRQQHTLVNTDEFYSSKQHKRRQYLCKVCSAFADTKTKSFETGFYCQQCSDTFAGRVPLCRHVRRVEGGNTLSCSQIRHDTWSDGKSIPPNLKKKIRFRKRKRDNEEEE